MGQQEAIKCFAEAEYIALSLAIQEGKWIHRLLCEIMTAANKKGPELMIQEDNQSCIKMTKNPVNHGRAKHIDIKYHHIRDEVKRGDVKLDDDGGHYDQGTFGTSSQGPDDGSRHPCEFGLRGALRVIANSKV